MSYTLMQGLGFGLGMLPVADKLKLKGEELIEFLKRHLNFFNSHPYFAVYALGAVARTEADKLPPAEIDKLKNMLMGPLGMFGDQVFWARFKPFVLCLAIVGLMILPWPLTLEHRPVCVGILFSALVFYNLIHFIIKWRAAGWGLRAGTMVLKEITRSSMLKFRLHISLTAAFIAGFFAVKAFDLSGQTVIFFPAFAAAFLALKLKAPLWVTLLFVFAVTIALTCFLKIALPLANDAVI